MLAAVHSDPVQARTGRSAETKLQELILDECVDDEVLTYLLHDGKPQAWEGSLWDYKRTLPCTSGRGDTAEKAANSHAIAELVKDVIAFHNVYGGYILAGVDQHANKPIIGCSNLDGDGFTIEKLNEKVQYYTKSSIICRFRKIPLPGSNNRYLGLILIPKRQAQDTVVRMNRAAPDRRNGVSVFGVGGIFARIHDTCVPVHEELQGLQLICSKRRFAKDPDSIAPIENNLPTRDPNLVKFIGRSDYLLALWNWLTERHSPMKILTALGGTGKTAIAFEFCRHLLANPPSRIEKVIWLTAKQQSFSAIHGQFVPITRTDFQTIDELLEVLAREVGAIDDDLIEVEHREDLLDLVLEGLETFPSLVVVDDIDSLPLDQQGELIATINNIACRTFEAGTRCLLTSRLELGIGSSYHLHVKGFERREFAEYAKMISKELNLKIKDSSIARLHGVSRGSPIFCASIFRLVALGQDINQAIQQWNGREGDDVRRFAFERELEQLTDSQARTLYALSNLGQTTQLELKQVLDSDDALIVRDLAKLREYHLFASRGDPGTGVRLEVPEPVRMMTDILENRILDPTRIKNECARARKRMPKVQDRVALSIASIIALWRAGDYDSALATAEQASKENSRSGDLHSMLGRCYLMTSPQKLEQADRSFRKAHELGCQRSELITNWLETRRLRSDWNGIVELVDLFAPPDIRGGSGVIAVDALLKLARLNCGRNDLPRALEKFRRAMFTASETIAQGRAGDRVSEIRQQCKIAAREYVNLEVSQNTRPGDKLSVFNAVMNAFKCHVTETWMIETALESIKTWTTDVVSRKWRDDDALDILEQRVQDLVSVHKQISGEDSSTRRVLADRVLTVHSELNGIELLKERRHANQEGYR